MIADKMDIIDSNLSIFVVSALLSSAVQLPGIVNGDLVGTGRIFYVFWQLSVSE